MHMPSPAVCETAVLETGVYMQEEKGVFGGGKKVEKKQRKPSRKAHP